MSPNLKDGLGPGVEQIDSSSSSLDLSPQAIDSAPLNLTPFNVTYPQPRSKLKQLSSFPGASLMEYCSSKKTLPPRHHPIVNGLQQSSHYRQTHLGPMKSCTLEDLPECLVLFSSKRRATQPILFYEFPKTIDLILEWCTSFRQFLADFETEQDKLQVLNLFLVGTGHEISKQHLTLDKALDQLTQISLHKLLTTSPTAPHQAHHLLISDYVEALTRFNFLQQAEEPEAAEEIKRSLRRSFFSGLGTHTSAMLATRNIKSLDKAIAYIQTQENLWIQMLSIHSDSLAQLAPRPRPHHRSLSRPTRRLNFHRQSTYSNQANRHHQPPSIYQTQYCTYHKSSTHDTSTCRRLHPPRHTPTQHHPKNHPHPHPPY
ncbi:hypothetical protein NEHOM01_0080 [Nematocida homosporus]|uniref:uncharacterized protein n=1 Tax=Nematocida homosporus TaxID=1912981 RepID=UPI00221E7BD0|nr:uncharacterized protein NEHOM01_0080 [Nematocida homosporus]KAI5184335.1 hypothetical protein NEHOM01_0080 [Nematocida homosporus]